MNNSSETLLVSFFDGEKTKFNLQKMAPNEGLGLGVVELDHRDDRFESFNRLW